MRLVTILQKNPSPPPPKKIRWEKNSHNNNNTNREHPKQNSCMLNFRKKVVDVYELIV